MEKPVPSPRWHVGLWGRTEAKRGPPLCPMLTMARNGLGVGRAACFFTVPGIHFSPPSCPPKSNKLVPEPAGLKAASSHGLELGGGGCVG